MSSSGPLSHDIDPHSAVPGKGRAAALYLALTFVLAYPISLHPGRLISSDAPDDHLFLWTLAWDTHAFVHQPLHIFDANILYPNQNTLAYSENLIGSALVAAPVIWITGNPILAANLVSLLSCVLCGLGAYVLGRRLGMSGPAALLCGIIFSFSPPRFFRFSQLHLTVVQWIPFCLASVHAYLDGGRRRDLILAVGWFTLEALSTGHGVVFLVAALLILLLYRAAMGEPIEPLRRLRDLGLTGAALIVPTFLFFLPYRQAQREVGLIRGLGSWDTTIQSFLASPTYVHAWLLSVFTKFDVNGTATAFLFPGYVPLALAALLLVLRRPGCEAPEPPADARLGPPRVWSVLAAIVNLGVLLACAAAVAVLVRGPFRLRLGSTVVLSARSALRAWTVVLAFVAARASLARRVPVAPLEAARRWRSAWIRRTAPYRRNPGPVYFGLWLFAIGVSLGPPVSLWPYLYALPVLNFIRVPSRFMIAGLLGLAVTGGLAFDRLAARWTGGRRRQAALVVGGLMLLEFAAMPVWHTSFAMPAPAADRWLNTRPKPFSVAEVPVTRSERNQSTFMLHSMQHWQKTVNGYSGIRPPAQDVLYGQMRRFPDEISLRSLVDLRVTYAVVHLSWYSAEERALVADRLLKFAPWLTLAYSDADSRVYLLHEPQGAQDAR